MNHGMRHTLGAAAEMPPKGSLVVGGALFLLAWLCPLFVPVVTAGNLPIAWKAAASGVLLIGLPELLTLAAIAVLGQSGYRYLKGRLLTALKLRALFFHVDVAADTARSKIVSSPYSEGTYT